MCINHKLIHAFCFLALWSVFCVASVRLPKGEPVALPQFSLGLVFICGLVVLYYCAMGGWGQFQVFQQQRFICIIEIKRLWLEDDNEHIQMYLWVSGSRCLEISETKWMYFVWRLFQYIFKNISALRPFLWEEMVCINGLLFCQPLRHYSSVVREPEHSITNTHRLKIQLRISFSGMYSMKDLPKSCWGFYSWVLLLCYTVVMYEKVFAEGVQTRKGSRAENSLHSTVHTKIFLGTQQGTLIGAAPPESRLEGYGRG